ncbi:MAG TPA: substrate-binding domain-containing protein [Candidatus Dormibacteraeota bacterium]|jgi:phosphate transport system substrate-binding protein|nr:substrate-binding domain-containing protein [Candidatus Dormibacteraeota bacterium]
MRSHRALTAAAATLAVVGWASASYVAGPTAFAGCVGGSATASGSTALQPLAQKASQDYHAQCAGATITVSGGGSSAGLSNVNSGTSDIGDSDVPATAAPGVNQANLQDHQVAIVVFAVVANNASGVSNLSTQQVQDIFSGKVTNWSAVGGKNQAITLIERKPGSGTRFTFDKCVMGAVAESNTPAAQEDSTQLVMQAVSSQPGAVSYVAVGSLNGATGVTGLKLNGASADGPSVANGSYGFFSHEHMYTNKTKNNATANDYISFISAPGYQSSALPPLGFLPLSTTPRQSAADKA